MTFPVARNTNVGWTLGVGWNAANLGSQEGAWSATTNVCGAEVFLDYAKYSGAAGEFPIPTENKFTAGGTAKFKVAISAAHDGYYEFRLCAPLKKGDVPTQDNQALIDCLLDPARGILLERAVSLKVGEQANYKGASPVWTDEQLRTRWRQEPQDGVQNGQHNSYPVYELEYKIPGNVQCDHCILHMYWQTLNNWQALSATDIATTSGERFWNCADVSITNAGATDDNGIIGGVVTVTPTCADGRKNGDEKGPDCGGSCGACLTCASTSCKTGLTCKEGTGGSPAFCQDNAEGGCGDAAAYARVGELQGLQAAVCGGAQFGVAASSDCCEAYINFVNYVEKTCTRPEELKLSTHKKSVCKYQCAADGTGGAEVETPADGVESDCVQCYPGSEGPCQKSDTACFALNSNGQCPSGTKNCGTTGGRRLLVDECTCETVTGKAQNGAEGCKARCNADSHGGTKVNQCWGSPPFFLCECQDGTVLAPVTTCASVCNYGSCRSATDTCTGSTCQPGSDAPVSPPGSSVTSSPTATGKLQPDFCSVASPSDGPVSAASIAAPAYTALAVYATFLLL